MSFTLLKNRPKTDSTFNRDNVSFVPSFSLGDLLDVEVDGVDSNDYPDFVDSFICYACIQTETGGFRDLTDEELEFVNDYHPDYVQELAYNSFH